LKARNLLFLIFLSLAACTKENIIIVPDNDPISYANISRLKIESYVNRLYIDLIGREPLKSELAAQVLMLQENELSRASRETLISYLMNDRTEREGDGSYQEAFTLNLYNLAKIRCLEGVADEEIQQQIGIARFGARIDSLEGNWDAYYKKQESIRRYQQVLDTRSFLLHEQIDYHQAFAAMVDNGIYDRINMNTFNFVRAVYDELLFRLPSEQEFETAFRIIEQNIPGTVFGKFAADKNEFIEAMIESTAQFEGMMIWAFQTYLNRPPAPAELVTFLPTYIQSRDIRMIINEIAVTDEYASFR
jgi:hypothetical protein